MVSYAVTIGVPAILVSLAMIALVRWAKLKQQGTRDSLRLAAVRRRRRTTIHQPQQQPPQPAQPEPQPEPQPDPEPDNPPAEPQEVTDTDTTAGVSTTDTPAEGLFDIESGKKKKRRRRRKKRRNRKQRHILGELEQDSRESKSRLALQSDKDITPPHTDSEAGPSNALVKITHEVKSLREVVIRRPGRHSEDHFNSEDSSDSDNASNIDLGSVVDTITFKGNARLIKGPLDKK